MGYFTRKEYLNINMKSTLVLLLATLLFTACKKDQPDTPTNANSNGIENTFGFGILSKLKGIWSGPVSSTTALGSYPKWIVDFRPISSHQISAKNELDSLNDIFMSFFIVKHQDRFKVAFRNGGGFNGMQRVSYLLADSVSEQVNSAYYRFSEVIQGKSRAYSELLFRADSIYLTSYTNGNLHMSWSAKLVNANAAISSVNLFNFPQKTMTKDFTNTFDGLTESIYFSPNTTPPSGDPYPDSDQPYLGVTQAQVTFSSSYTPIVSNKVMLLFTTEPLFNGLAFNSAALNSISRYVFVSPFSGFTFSDMHPGSYYYYALYDQNGNQTFDSGDWISSANTQVNLGNLGNIGATTQINFTIP